jgi:tRNA(fMet)-specific endonuclease VapC
MICLDTNVVIVLINRRNANVRSLFEEQLALRVEIALPAICLFEMRHGHARSDRPTESDRQLEMFLAQGISVVPFDEEDAAHAGDIRAALEAKGTPIGAYDILIAAQARRRGAVLVTSNTREFQRVPGLLVVNWAA